VHAAAGPLGGALGGAEGGDPAEGPPAVDVDLRPARPQERLLRGALGAGAADVGQQPPVAIHAVLRGIRFEHDPPVPDAPAELRRGAGEAAVAPLGGVDPDQPYPPRLAADADDERVPVDHAQDAAGALLPGDAITERGPAGGEEGDEDEDPGETHADGQDRARGGGTRGCGAAEVEAGEGGRGR
jgi:hypothetical protein